MSAPKVTHTPDRVWLNYGEVPGTVRHDECAEVTWSKEALGPADVEYVRADRLRALLAKWERCGVWPGFAILKVALEGRCGCGAPANGRLGRGCQDCEDGEE